MALKDWLDQLSPDLFATLRRFRFAVVLGLAAAILLIMQINNAVPPGDDTAMRVLFGLWTGAALATAGALFSESRPQAWIAGLILTYAVPIVAVGLFLMRDSTLFIPYLLPVAAILWLSVSPATVIGATPAEREAQQNRFWWINHLAVASAAIAIVAFGVIAIGTIAIERSLDVLFGLEVGGFVYNYLLPFVGAFLAPLYWLATIPRPQDYRADAVESPEFVSNAIGLIGQFLLVPILFVYGAILLAYAVQIAVTQRLPEGMLGWMVLGFTVTGAATWLLLHPPFLRGRWLVRMFHNFWFWLTIVPLVLYAVAVAVRIDAYGLTLERMLLIAGGTWAVVLSVAFLMPRTRDIRLIPALAGVILLAFSIGPWNIEELPRANQLARLEAALDAAFQAGPTADWTQEQREIARGAIDYLASREPAHERLQSLLAERRVTAFAGDLHESYAIRQHLGLDEAGPSVAAERRLVRDPVGQPVDVAATPRLLGTFTIAPGSVHERLGLGMTLEGNVLMLTPTQGSSAQPQGADLGPWVAAQPPQGLGYPSIDFTFGGNNYRIAVDELVLADGSAGGGSESIASISGTLFIGVPPPQRPTPGSLPPGFAIP